MRRILSNQFAPGKLTESRNAASEAVSFRRITILAFDMFTMLKLSNFTHFYLNKGNQVNGEQMIALHLNLRFKSVEWTPLFLFSGCAAH